MSILNRTFSLAEMSMLSNTNAQTIKAWYGKGFPVKSGVTGGGGAGQRREFSFFSAIEVTIAAALSATIGGARDMQWIFERARSYAHAADGGATFDLPERLPGLPFHHSFGETIFAVSSARTCEVIWKPGSGHDTFGQIRNLCNSDHFISLNTSKVFNAFCARIGLDAREILDAEYLESGFSHSLPGSEIKKVSGDAS
tara:strand:+ start:280 stop:873 length:594 start_codon:yes stop_codon:yes gene_type:complete